MSSSFRPYNVTTDDQLLIQPVVSSDYANYFSTNASYQWRNGFKAANKQIKYITADNPTGLIKDLIKFDTTRLTGQWYVPKDFQYCTSFTLKSSTGATPFTSDTKLALKGALTDLVSSLWISFTGSPISAQENLPLGNYLDMVTRCGVEWYETRAADLHFSLDDQLNAIAQGKVSVTQTTIGDPAATGAVAGTPATFSINSPPYSFENDNTAANKGFTERSSMLIVCLVSSESGVNTYVVFIPLMWISPVFACMGFPVTNMGMEIKIAHNFQDGNYPFPFMTTSDTDAISVNIDTTVLGGARLYYYQYTFYSEDQAILNEHLQKGLNFTIDVEVPIDLRIPLTNTTMTSFSQPVSDRAQRPTKIVYILPPTGQLRSQTLPHVFYNNTKLTYAQTYIDTTPYYENAPQLDDEHFERFLEAVPLHQYVGEGALINRDFWKKKFRVYIHDISRLKDASNENPSGHNISCKLQRTDNSAVDLIILTYGIRTLKIDLSFGGCKIQYLESNSN